MRFPLALLALLLVLTPARADIDPALREEGVLYFEDNLPDHLVAKAVAPTTIYLRRDFQSALAYVAPGSAMELVGMSTAGYLVKADYRNNTVTGWILPSDLPPGIDPAVITAAKKNQVRRDQVAAAIAQKRVIRGMTPDEVHRSLGEPEQESSKTDGSGTANTWVFTTYADVYQTSYGPGFYGRTTLQTYPVRVPFGQLIVTFANGTVVSIQEHKTNPDRAAVGTE